MMLSLILVLAVPNIASFFSVTFVDFTRLNEFAVISPEFDSIYFTETGFRHEAHIIVAFP